MRGHGGFLVRQVKEDVLFFEKKNQKTFVCVAPRKVKQIRAG